MVFIFLWGAWWREGGREERREGEGLGGFFLCVLLLLLLVTIKGAQESKESREVCVVAGERERERERESLTRVGDDGAFFLAPALCIVCSSARSSCHR